MVRNMRPYFILYDIKCPEELNFLVCHKDQGGAQSKFQETSPLLQRKNSKIEKQKHFPRGGKMLAPSYPGVAFVSPCHPMATGLVGPTSKFVIGMHTQVLAFNLLLPESRKMSNLPPAPTSLLKAFLIIQH